MPEATEPARRRRARRQATAQQGPPQVARVDAAPNEQVAKEPAPKQVRRRDPKGRGRPGSGAHGDRDLAGTVTSQVGPTGAMRARDLNRPTAEDLAQAEAELTIVRRNWDPHAPSPRPRSG